MDVIVSEETNETNSVGGLVVLICIGAGAYFGYTTVFPSERSQVRACVSAMLEAARRQVGYGELRNQLAELDAAETISITEESRRDFGDSTLVMITYQIDGRTSRIMCAQ